MILKYRVILRLLARRLLYASGASRGRSTVSLGKNLKIDEARLNFQFQLRAYQFLYLGISINLC